MVIWFLVSAAAAAAKSLRSCPTLCDPIDGSLPGSSTHGIFLVSVAAAAAKSLQSCPTLCDPIDGSLPGSSTHGIFQARADLCWQSHVSAFQYAIWVGHNFPSKE